MEKTAILLIEFQKTWTEKGIFHKMIRKELTKRNVLANTKAVVSAARKHRVQVIQAPLILDKTDKERYKKTPFPARLFKRFTKGTRKAEFTDGIYESSDIVVKGRYGFDACEGSDLEQILIENNIKKVYVCGFTSEHCVKETMNSLTEIGYHCILVSDCTATRNKKLQKKVENEFETISGRNLVNEIVARKHTI